MHSAQCGELRAVCIVKCGVNFEMWQCGETRVWQCGGVRVESIFKCGVKCMWWGESRELTQSSFFVWSATAEKAL